MAIFEYTAIDAGNEIFRGQVSSWTKRRATQQLTTLRLTVITMKKIRRWNITRAWLHRPVTTMDRIVVTRSLLTMLQAGMSISETLRSTREQTGNPRLQKAIQQIEQRIQAGQPLATSLAAFPGMFPAEYIAMIRVGERSGKLVEVLQFLTTKLERDYELQRRLRGAMVYPVLIFVFMGLMIAVMMLFVIPRIAAVYADADVVMPVYTRALVAMSSFVAHWGWLSILGALILGLSFDTGMRQWLGFRRAIHRLLLRLPMIGIVVKKVNLIVVSRTLSMLLKAGLTIDEALLLTSTTTRNTVYRETFVAAGPLVARGVRLTDIFAGDPQLFPPVFHRMIATGEQSGNLDSMFGNVAQYYQRDVEHWSTNFSSLVEPILITFVGIVVGALAVAILFPLWNFVNVIT